jgi:hypothetical protein
MLHRDPDMRPSINHILARFEKLFGPDATEP